MFQLFRDGRSPEQEAEALRERLNAVKRLIQAGHDVWRNRQRARYLEQRLQKLTGGQ